MLLLLYTATLAISQKITFAQYHIQARGIAVEALPHGYAYVGLNYCDNQPNATCSVVVVADSVGELVHKKVFPDFYGSGIRYRPEDSTFFIWGERLIKPTPTGGDWAVVLMKTTFQGDTIWSFEYNEGKFDLCRDILELSDGSIMMFCPQYVGYGGIKIARVSAKGQLIWAKEYISDAFLRLYLGGLLALNDSTVLINTIGQYGGQYEGIHLYYIDYDGHVLRDTAHYTAPSQKGDTDGQLRRLTNGRLVISTSYQTLGPSGCINGCASFAEILPDGGIKKITHFPFDHATQTINEFSATLDGNIISCGVGSVELLGAPWNDYVNIAKISPDGPFIWERFLPHDLMYVVGDVKPTPDGGYIVIGTQERPRPGGGYEYYAALVKLDGKGCLEPNCDSLLVTSPVGEVPPSQPTSLWRVLGNPARESCTFQAQEPISGLSRFQLTDAQGREVYTAEFGGQQYTFERRGLEAGLYFFKIQTEHDGTATGKIVLHD